MFKAVDYSGGNSRSETPEHELEPTASPPTLKNAPMTKVDDERNGGESKIREEDPAYESKREGNLSSLPSFHRRPLTDTPVISRWTSPKAVSYTHLDVYKRQI